MPINASELFTIEQLRYHLRVDDADDTLDTLISYYAEAALGYCLWYCDEPAWQKTADIPKQVGCATLLVLADLFENRSSRDDSIKYINPTADNLLFSCRNFANKTNPENNNGYFIKSY